MVVSIVENWDIMSASAQIVTSTVPRKTMVRGSDNHHLRYTMEVQILRSIRVNGITCVEKVNHVIAEQAQDARGVVLGTFPVNSMPATVLFDFGASHSFITKQFVAKHNIPMSSMKTHLLIGSPNGEMKSTYVCPRVNLKIRGIDFQADLVVLTSSGIDVILGMDWLGECDGIILCAKRSLLITCPQGDRIELVATAPSKEEGKADQDRGK
jgi:hypothetical protein